MANTQLTFYGHAAFKVLTPTGNVLLIDPWLTNPTFDKGNEELAALKRVDLILLTHGHGDHVGDTVDIAHRTGATAICNYEISGWLGKQKVKAHGMQHGGGHKFPFGYCKLTLAFHGSQLPDGSEGGNPCGFLIKFNDGKMLYNAADTGLFGDMKLIGEEGIDLACLPIGDNFTMGPDDALRAVKLLTPKKVMPMHYDTFPLIAQDANAWAARVKSQTQATPVVLTPGDWIDL